MLAEPSLAEPTDPVSDTSEPHLTNDVLAAYVDRTLPETARRAADSHLTTCRPCRDELSAVSALLAARRGSRRWARLAAPAAALAAAAIAFMMFGTWRAPAGPGGSSDERMRESTEVTIARDRVAIVSPAEGDTVSPDRMSFVWRPFGSGGTYLMRLSDESTVRWTVDTGDTSVVLPDSVRLERGRNYHWWVDGITADGRAVTTGVRRFRTAQ